jgi:mannose-6-phosphate isomerase-like protein (cupin superfamily)
MNINLLAQTTKANIFLEITAELEKQNFTIVKQDQSRPWGGFFVLDEAQTAQFAKLYFPHIELTDLQITQKLSPKLLVVAPEKRLSWQYHFRRAEIWKVIAGTVGVVTSDTDEEGALQTLSLGAVISLHQGQRHRLVGLQEWGVLAEIWQHTDIHHPSDESDIVRVQDDFGR